MNPAHPVTRILVISPVPFSPKCHAPMQVDYRVSPNRHAWRNQVVSCPLRHGNTVRKHSHAPFEPSSQTTRKVFRPSANCTIVINFKAHTCGSRGAEMMTTSLSSGGDNALPTEWERCFRLDFRTR